jgi:hypothetical protein
MPSSVCEKSPEVSPYKFSKCLLSSKDRREKGNKVNEDKEEKKKFSDTEKLNIFQLKSHMFRPNSAEVGSEI